MQSDLTFPDAVSGLLGGVPLCDGKFEVKGVCSTLLPAPYLPCAGQGFTQELQGSFLGHSCLLWNHTDTGCADVWQALLLPVSSLVPPSTGGGCRLC